MKLIDIIIGNAIAWLIIINVYLALLNIWQVWKR